MLEVFIFIITLNLGNAVLYKALMFTVLSFATLY